MVFMAFLMLKMLLENLEMAEVSMRTIFIVLVTQVCIDLNYWTKETCTSQK